MVNPWVKVVKRRLVEHLEKGTHVQNLIPGNFNHERGRQKSMVSFLELRQREARYAQKCSKDCKINHYTAAHGKGREN